MSTKKEEIEYIKKIKNGNRDSLEEFIRANQKIIISLAKKYAFYAEMIPDLVIEGNLGFITAIEKYDLKKNTKFSTYSYFWIKKFIFSSIVNQFQEIKAPWYVYSLKKKYNDYISVFKLKNNRMPTNKEICKELDISAELFSKIRNYFSYLKISPSIEKKQDEEPFDIFEITDIDDKDQIINMLNNEEILDRIFKRLKKDSKKAHIDSWFVILKMFFGLNGQRQYSYKEIAEQINISRQRVHKIIKTILKKLKEEYKEMKSERII